MHASIWRLYDASGYEPSMVAHQADVSRIEVYDKLTWERLVAQYNHEHGANEGSSSDLPRPRAT